MSADPWLAADHGPCSVGLLLKPVAMGTPLGGGEPTRFRPIALDETLQDVEHLALVQADDGLCRQGKPRRVTLVDLSADQPHRLWLLRWIEGLPAIATLAPLARVEQAHDGTGQDQRADDDQKQTGVG